MGNTIHIHTAEELRQRPDGWTFERHLQAVKQAAVDHSDALQSLLKRTENKGEWKAEDRRTFDAHESECGSLRMLAKTLEMSPEGQEVDLSKVVQTGIGSDEQRGYDNQGRHTGGGLTYRPDDTVTSWVKDLRAVADGGSPAAQERLARNSREVASAEKRALTSYTAGAASELVPPTWALNLIATVARPARVTADQISNNVLPPNAMTINVPRILTGTSVAAQATENTTVSDTNVSTDMISSLVHTLAGKQTLSFQIVDQSPVNVDRLIIEDLAAELARQVDLFVLTSNATGKFGILNQSGTSVVAYTDGTPTPGELYAKIADGIQRVSTTRFLPPDKIVMHPRRWAWFLAALDSSGRPLVLPEANHPMNAVATQGGVVAQGAAGTLQGLPVYLDAVLPVNGGAGTNQDSILILRSSDLLLWESPTRIVADRISLAGQLSLQIVLWEYAAIQMGRYPTSTSLVQGTGLVTPTF